MNREIDLNRIPDSVLYAMYQIEQSGFNAYLTGGATRDILLNRVPHDYDITTAAPLEVLQSIFPDCKVVGASFGVVLIKVGRMEIQVARFRTEHGYSDYRHPDTVVFTDDIMEDLRRRDFTINTFSVNAKGNLVYVEGALEDLSNRAIRAVGNPDDRFQEDPLRMLRAIRFSCQLDFRISHAVKLSIQRNAKLIKNISAERIQEELNKILLSDSPAKGIVGLGRTDLLNHIIPEYEPCVGFKQNDHHLMTVDMHTLMVLDNVPKDLVLRLAALFHDLGKPESMAVDDKGVRHFYGGENKPPHQTTSAVIAFNRMRALKYDNDTINNVHFYVSEHMFIIDPDVSPKHIRRMVNKYGEERLRKLLILKRADWIGSGKKSVEEIDTIVNKFISKIDKVMGEKPPVVFNDLAIDGHEIMQILGYTKPCKEIGKVKEILMNLVLTDPSYNTKERLSSYVESLSLAKPPIPPTSKQEY